MAAETVDVSAARVPLRRRMPLGPNGPLGLLVDPMTWRAVPYLLGSGLWGAGCLAVLVCALLIAFAVVPLGAGVPMLALIVPAWRGAAAVERRTLRLAFGVVIPAPYRRPDGSGPFTRWKGMAVDPATWKDLLYLLLLGPIGLGEFVVSTGLWSLALVLIVAPPLVSLGADPLPGAGETMIGTVPGALLCLPAGLVALSAALYATRGMAWLHALLAVALLGPGRKDLLAARLRAGRARAVAVAEAERRRIERDLHDGAQQRLVSVAMDLGRARARMETDPEGARELLAQAHAGAKAAIAELRDLARGIHPAILTDRGLDAALSSLAARAPVRVSLSVEISHRPPAAVESIAYFVVAEALTNTAKHAGATEASVRVGFRGRRVVVEVRDNGAGGAAPRAGGGLAGLADRAAVIDGVLGVDSPPGGPTVIRAELPCEW